MAPSLTTGFIAALIEGTDSQTEQFRTPTLQLHGDAFKTVKERKSIAFSDGKHTYTGILAKSPTELIEKGELKPSSIIKVLHYNRVNSDKRVLFMIVNCEVLETSAPLQGNPVPVGAVKKNDGSPVKAEAPSSEQSQDVEMKDTVATSPTPKGPSAASSTPPTVSKKAPENKATVTPLASLPMSQGKESIVPIQALSPYMSRWTIKARILSKQPLRSIPRKNGGGESKVFSVNLIDQSCDIKATFWNDAAEKFQDVFVVGKCYTFSKGRAQIANQRFNDTKSQYELSFNADAVIQLCEDTDAPSVTYNFCSIDKLETMIGKVVDVLGVVTDVQSSTEITIKNGPEAGKQKLKRTVSIADQSGKQILLALWDDHAMAVSEDDASRRPILSIRAARVGDYGGCSLSTGRSSVVQIDANIDEVATLRTWYESQGSASSFQAVGGGGGGGAGAGPAPRKAVKDIVTEKLGTNASKADVFSLRCTVQLFRGTDDTSKWQYPSNPENKRKVVAHGDRWLDESSQRTLDTCVRRYILGLCVADHTGVAWVSAFDDQASVLLGGKSADDLFALTEMDPAAAAGVWKGALFKTYTVKVRAKTERYQDEDRVKCSLLSCEPVNYKREGQGLLEQIRRYVG